MANVSLARKAEDGKKKLVEFTSQFHAHLVKCAIALVSHPIYKVKQVMYGFILELLNREGPQAFFNLTKGPQLGLRRRKSNFYSKEIAHQGENTKR
jgi:hypothetical protein